MPQPDTAVFAHFNNRAVTRSDRIPWTTVFWLWALSPLIQAQAPATGCRAWIYVEPHEIRQECLFKAHSFRDQFGIGDAEQISTSDQARALEATKNLISSSVRVQLNGVAVPWQVDYVGFVTVDPENGVIPDTRDTIPVADALIATRLGAVANPFGKTLNCTWTVFPDNGMPTSIDFAGPGKNSVFHLFNPGDPAFVWRIPAANATPLPLPLPPTPIRREVKIPWLSLLCLLALGALAFMGSRRKHLPRPIAPVALALGIATFVLWKAPAVTVKTSLDPKTMPNEGNRELIIEALLEQIYHAFDYRDESAIYDALALSLKGKLLETVYLQIHRQLELESQGGARVKIREVSMRDAESNPTNHGFTAQCEWVVIGDVTHWGHTHMRANKYSAALDVTATSDDQWKITRLDLQDENRL